MKQPQAPGYQSLHIEIGLRSLLLAAVVVGLVWLLPQLWSVVLVVVVALMLVGALVPPIRWLESKGMRRGWAIAAVFGALFSSTTLFFVLTVPQLAAQVSDIVEQLPRMQSDLGAMLESGRLTAPLARSVRGTGSTEMTTKAAQWLLAYSTKIVEFMAYAATALFLALYLIIDRDRMRGAAFALVPRTFHVRLSRILLNLETIVGGYVRGQVITSVLMAVFTFAVLTIARVPNALAIAAFAGIADVLPYVGGILACGPAVLAAWPRGWGVALAVLVALVLYQELESRVIVPRVYGNALRLPPSVVLVALLAGGTLLGIVGALLALPLAAAVRMIVEELRVALPGEEENDPRVLARDASGERTFERRAVGAPAEKAAVIATKIAEEQIKEDVAARAEEDGTDGTAAKS
jgi:predicted PurR-regulated permease PerM